MKENDHYQMKKKKIKFKKTILNLMLTIIRLKELFYGVINQLKIYQVIGSKRSKFFFYLIKVPKTTELIKKSAADSIDNRKVTQDLEK